MRKQLKTSCLARDELVPETQFHQHFTCAFFIRKFVQSQNVTRKKAFVLKRRTKNVDEIDSCMTKNTASGLSGEKIGEQQVHNPICMFVI